MAPKFSLARAQEQREMKRREEEYKINELNRYYSSMRAQEAGHKGMEKDELVRRRREHLEREREYRTLESMYKTQQESKISRQLAEDADRVAAAIEAKEKTEQRKAREVQQLVEGSEELRDLQMKIRTAQMNKELKDGPDEQGEDASAEGARPARGAGEAVQRAV
uniref:Meiosis-specific nuclear structural protein 1 n=1 Tax=Tetraselmis sp. GSL018 TaxID=582737 RepID=A0A061S638_9CHLO